ncbi:hypothetical protein MBIO_0848 [Mycoplasmopsis fermentans PG18]|uniref:1-phosphofructokinase n=2 Tax=Mycoplasmopsis fermentans TaxID=2115 RepID=C4XG41_MYCFP|nr:1-phosphofructokinase [Mycoplasmopsis fermentans]ADV34690.1 Fructose-1-phosphate kinase [Mycoplasmopsis fermentans M64]BAH70113.1 hypothetical protein MBIO_0848 [Mycoplasmopsis fermentans PG18]VEU63843.1 1-phosphofructokinase [Mycoplasmopsis fermentans]VEU67166.1 1-phosphofructokinase [Mesomycoplasma conjunctivae]
MIYTVTFSPAIDYTMSLEGKINIGDINRSKSENYTVGGKGINVSILLNNLGTKNVALGFVGGFTGQYIINYLKDKKVKTDFCNIEGNSRINVKLNGKAKETAINANGPKISDQNLKQLLDKIAFNIKDNDTLILAGNVPKNVDTNVYELILEKLKNKRIYIIVDSTKQFLLNTLKYKPFLIKPNLEELEELFDEKVKTKEDIKSHVEKLKKLGARNVLVSCGAEGAYLFSEDNQTFYSATYKGKVVSTVGSGDSMIAGFIDNYLKNKDYKQALEFSIACGAATAFDKEIANKSAILELLERGQKWK